MAEVSSAKDLAKQGNAAYKREDYAGAARLFEAAQVSYTQQGDELTAAEMANNACVAHMQAGDAEAALRCVEGTDSLFASAGDLRRQGMAVANRAAALEMLDRDEEAGQAYLQASQILEQAGEDQMRAQVMQSLSMLQLNMGRQLQALVSMQQGVEGVKHPSPKQRFVKKLLQIPMDMMRKKS